MLPLSLSCSDAIQYNLILLQSVLQKMMMIQCSATNRIWTIKLSQHCTANLFRMPTKAEMKKSWKIEEKNHGNCSIANHTHILTRAEKRNKIESKLEYFKMNKKCWNNFISYDPLNASAYIHTPIWIIVSNQICAKVFFCTE